MMLQIDHRESHDVDIFLSDPQTLAFLDPQKHHFSFEIVPSDYRGDGTKTLKFAFGKIGEIDFIVASPLTPEPTTLRTIEGVQTHLETIPEIIAKKIFHRGAAIKPRDIFDIAAASENRAPAIIDALRPYKSAVNDTLAAIAKLNPHFINGAIAELIIKPRYETIAKTAIERATSVLREV